MSDSVVEEHRPPRPVGQEYERGKLTDWIVTVILGQINDGTLGPGVQLRQRDIAESLGVSRVPVREALQVLARQRELVHEERRGFFVAQWSSDELRQLARTIELIENDVLATVRWPTTAEFDRLTVLSDRMQQLAPSSDVLAFVEANHEFHFMIFGLSPNTLMIEELERLWRLARRFITRGMMGVQERLDRVAEHRAILERMECRDKAGFMDASIRHRGRCDATGESTISGVPVLSLVASGPPAS